MLGSKQNLLWVWKHLNTSRVCLRLWCFDSVQCVSWRYFMPCTPSWLPQLCCLTNSLGCHEHGKNSSCLPQDPLLSPFLLFAGVFFGGELNPHCEQIHTKKKKKEKRAKHGTAAVGPTLAHPAAVAELWHEVTVALGAEMWQVSGSVVPAAPANDLTGIRLWDPGCYRDSLCSVAHPWWCSRVRSSVPVTSMSCSPSACSTRWKGCVCMHSRNVCSGAVLLTCKKKKSFSVLEIMLGLRISSGLSSKDLNSQGTAAVTGCELHGLWGQPGTRTRLYVCA